VLGRKRRLFDIDARARFIYCHAIGRGAGRVLANGGATCADFCKSAWLGERDIAESEANRSELPSGSPIGDVAEPEPNKPEDANIEADTDVPKKIELPTLVIAPRLHGCVLSTILK
jgi:hypothetical protein